MTRLGSFLQFAVVIVALTLFTHGPPHPVANLSLLTIFTLWTWTGSWGCVAH